MRCVFYAIETFPRLFFSFVFFNEQPQIKLMIVAFLFSDSHKNRGTLSTKQPLASFCIFRDHSQSYALRTPAGIFLLIFPDNLSIPSVISNIISRKRVYEIQLLKADLIIYNFPNCFHCFNNWYERSRWKYENLG